MFIQRQVLIRSSVGWTRRTFVSAAAGGTSSTSHKKDEEKKLRIVVAVGGNALQRRGDRLTIENMLKAAATMAPTMAHLAKKHELGKKILQVFAGTNIVEIIKWISNNGMIYILCLFHRHHKSINAWERTSSG